MQYIPENAATTDKTLPINQILCGDNLELIQKLPDCSVQLVITSPPYFQQRDYGGGMGNEKNVDEYVDILLLLFQECVRVVRDGGTVRWSDRWTHTAIKK